MLDVTRKLVELLDLSPIGDDHFQGDSEDLGFPHVFGGQVLGQARWRPAGPSKIASATPCMPISCALAITACQSIMKSSAFGMAALFRCAG